MATILNDLEVLGEGEYKAFMSPLIPTVPEERMLGVRIPKLRLYAKKIRNSDRAREFLSSCPHFYFDENNLHAFLIESISNYGECLKAVNDFLLYIDNWATCDSLSPKVFAENKDLLIDSIKQWIRSDHVYTVRFGVVMLMKHYLTDYFDEEHFCLLADISTEEYYINMAISWYFATALAFQYDAALQFIKSGRLTTFVHNKAITKATESCRISKERKNYLKTLKKAP